jgi:hypothetical protein
MKRTTILVLVTSLALGAGAWADKAREETAAEVAALYNQGVSALQDGDAVLAKECFTNVLRIEPSHGNAKFQLLKIKNDGPRLAALVRQKKLEKIIVPKIDFAGTTLPEAVEGLNILIEKETKGEFAANFIIQDPKGLFDKRPVTIKLGKVPASVALEYILRMADASVRYDEYAIVIRPIGGNAAATPASDSKDESTDRFGN